MINPEIPLIIDLDGTLIKTDLLLESFYALIKENPFSIFCVPVWLIRGKIYFKNQLAKRVNIKAKLLPYNDDFLAYLNNEVTKGRKLVLATASVKKFAVSVADHLGIFADVLASDEKLNLSGNTKLKLFLEKYGEKEFDYAGNAKSDLHIFQHARYAILVNSRNGVIRTAKKIAEVKQVFNDKKNDLWSYFKAIRVYQWAKNFLLFIPLITSHKWNDGPAITSVFLGFVSFGFCASGGYIFNDLLDIWADRNHPQKKLRPFASGDVSIWEGSIVMVAILLFGLAIATVLSRRFFILLALYCLISLAYTFKLKTYVLIDVLVLAGLYTLRVVAGAVLADVYLSFWLFAFSIFIFFSLALVKRYSELITLSKTNAKSAWGRDYRVSDMDYLREMGIASGYLAIVIVAFYINSPNVTVLYSHPKLLWLLCPILFYWVSRLWLKTGRGEMTDDPIVFSVKDKGSRYVAVATIIIILLSI